MALRADVLSRHKQEWEELAKVDPLWAILTSSGLDAAAVGATEFFATGEAEISEMLKVADDSGSRCAVSGRSTSGVASVG